MKASPIKTAIRHHVTGRFTSRAKATLYVTKADKYAAGILADADSFPQACRREALKEYFYARKSAAYYAKQLGGQA